MLVFDDKDGFDDDDPTKHTHTHAHNYFVSISFHAVIFFHLLLLESSAFTLVVIVKEI